MADKPLPLSLFLQAGILDVQDPRLILHDRDRLAYVAGALISERILSNLGLKRTTLIMVTLLGASTMIRFVFLNAVVAVVLGFTTCLFSGIFSAAAQGLNLEQIPRLRGAMMSMTSAFGSIGSVLSLSLVGVFLIEYGWGVMGLIIGAFGILAGGVLLLFAREHTQHLTTNQRVPSQSG